MQSYEIANLQTKYSTTFEINFIYPTGNDVRKFEIYETDIEAPGFRDYHERLQTFILFFIDGASFIDVDDDRWKFYLLYVT